MYLHARLRPVLARVPVPVLRDTSSGLRQPRREHLAWPQRSARTWSLLTSWVMWIVSGGCGAASRSTVARWLETAGRLIDERLTLLDADIFCFVCCESTRELSDVMNVLEYTVWGDARVSGGPCGGGSALIRRRTQN